MATGIWIVYVRIPAVLTIKRLAKKCKIHIRRVRNNDFVASLNDTLSKLTNGQNLYAQKSISAHFYVGELLKMRFY